MVSSRSSLPGEPLQGVPESTKGTLVNINPIRICAHTQKSGVGSTLYQHNIGISIGRVQSRTLTGNLQVSLFRKGEYPPKWIKIAI
jgi:hypothetical protein